MGETTMKQSIRHVVEALSPEPCSADIIIRTLQNLTNIFADHEMASVRKRLTELSRENSLAAWEDIQEGRIRVYTLPNIQLPQSRYWRVDDYTKRPKPPADPTLFT
jgi:hypothetical protein